MKIIKHDTSIEPSEKLVGRASSRSVLNSEEFEAKSAAQKIIEEAKAQAAEILAQAERDKEDIFAQAQAEGAEAAAAEATGELAKAKMQAGQVLADSEASLVKLALQVAEKIIGEDLKRDPQVVLAICATAIEQVRYAKAMVLRVNPSDGALLREKRPRLMERVARTVDIAIKDDPEVEPGGCILQTEFGTVDAQLKTQFEMLRQVLVPDTAKKEGLR